MITLNKEQQEGINPFYVDRPFGGCFLFKIPTESKVRSHDSADAPNKYKT